MNVRDLLCGMEDRAMDSQFQKDICAIYHPKDFGDTEPDCEVGYSHLLPLLTVDQKTSLEKMEQAYIQRRAYAAKYGFKCGMYGAFRQYFGASVAQDAGFQDLLCDDLLTQPGMQRHQENYADIELCNQLEQSIMDTLSEEDREYMVNITCAWQQRVYSAAHDGFYCGFRAAYDVMDAIVPMAKIRNMEKILITEYLMGYIQPYSEIECLQDLAA